MNSARYVFVFAGLVRALRLASHLQQPSELVEYARVAALEIWSGAVS